jgi:hypothetical protein
LKVHSLVTDSQGIANMRFTMVLDDKKLTASPSKTTPTGAVVISAPAPDAGTQGTAVQAGETPSQAMLSRYIASRLKQFGTR